MGPIDGHNLDHLLPVLKNVREARRTNPILVHVVTQKGKGYAPAEEAAAEEAPAEEAPAEETPAEDAPAEEAKKEEASAEEAPAEDAAASEEPAPST